MAVKTLLVCLDAFDKAVSILVPKRRGEGFLKSPLGHHHDRVSQIAHEIELDIYGLDGALEVQTGSLHGKDTEALLERIMPPLCQHYQMDFRVIARAEFWKLHPLGEKQ